MRLSEFELIERIRRIAGAARPPVVRGIGDDCAVLDHTHGDVSLHTTDCLVEGVHFRRDDRSGFDVGWKAVAANLSDIAAMGGSPVAFLMTLIVPHRAHLTSTLSNVERVTRGSQSPYGRGLEKFLLDAVRGVVACGRQFGAQLAGGNISSTRRDALIIDVSMIGAAKKGRILTRAGARPGDLIHVSGFPGRSAAGLEILESARSRPAPGDRRLVRTHLRPIPQLALGRELARRRLATACIDTSDGLVQDLGRICEASGAGATIDATKIPLSPALRRYGGATKKDPLDFALSGGEDYGLVFTAPPANHRAIDALGRTLRVRLTAIGEMTETRRVTIVGGASPRARGWDHLR